MSTHNLAAAFLSVSCLRRHVHGLIAIVGLFPKARNERIVNFANLSEKQAEICRKLNFQNLIVADFEFFAFEKFAGLGTRPIVRNLIAVTCPRTTSCRRVAAP